MVPTRYALDEFIHDTTDLVATQPDRATLFDNFSGRATVEIHVYGRDSVGLERCRYDLATGKISSYVLGKYDNC